MSRNYDNWERLVAAVIKRQQIWELCHQHSRTPSTCSEASSSDFSSSFRSDFELEKKEESMLKPVPKPILVKRALRSMREVGNGRFGTSILTQLRRKVRFPDQEFLAKGTHLVMKKLVGEVKVTEEEFYNKIFGICRHENVAAPRAFNLSKNGNFVFNDFHSQGSVYDMLHGEENEEMGFRRLNWESRLKVAVGAARGIAHLHAQSGGKLAHGNIRSSNIFLNSEQYGCVSDFGLAAVMRTPREWVGEGYHASEHEFKNAFDKSDVYSFGVVLLELLTGRSPVEDTHIVEWARSMRPEDLSPKLFDDRISFWSSDLYLQRPRILRCDEIDGPSFKKDIETEIKGQIVAMFEVAIRCVALFPVDRPKIFEVELMLENICERMLLEPLIFNLTSKYITFK